VSVCGRRLQVFRTDVDEWSNDGEHCTHGRDWSKRAQRTIDDEHDNHHERCATPNWQSARRPAGLEVYRRIVRTRASSTLRSRETAYPIPGKVWSLCRYRVITELWKDHNIIQHASGWPAGHCLPPTIKSRVRLERVADRLATTVYIYTFLLLFYSFICINLQ